MFMPKAPIDTTLKIFNILAVATHSLAFDVGNNLFS